jgi:hypothetical protein
MLYEFTFSCDCPFEKEKLAYYVMSGRETHCRTRDLATVSNIVAPKLLLNNKSLALLCFGIVMQN